MKAVTDKQQGIAKWAQKTGLVRTLGLPGGRRANPFSKEPNQHSQTLSGPQQLWGLVVKDCSRELGSAGPPPGLQSQHQGTET